MARKIKLGPKITGKTQKGQEIPALWSEDQARDYFESRRWPNGPACVHCSSANVYRVGGKSHRPGLFECRDCREQFTVTVGTVMEDSHLPLKIWAMAFHFMTTAKKGMSALQLQRNLGLGSYRTAWFLAHRIREAMRYEPVAGMLKGDVQVDETYVGPDRKNLPGAEGRDRNRYNKKHKLPVMVLVDSTGRAHAQPITATNTKNLKAVMEAYIDPAARIITDQLNAYRKATLGFAGGHRTVNHSQDEYVTPDGLHTNSGESYFGLLKRGIHGTFHHISPKHMQRYCDEFSFRWTEKNREDVNRRDAAVDGAEGKRLFYRQPVGEA